MALEEAGQMQVRIGDHVPDLSNAQVLDMLACMEPDVVAVLESLQTQH